MHLHDNEKDNPITEIFDNGTGMDYEICSKYLLSIGTKPFWTSERCYRDWGSEIKKVSIIASHGIGFLRLLLEILGVLKL